MPICLRPFHGAYVHCAADATGAFEVSFATASLWDRLTTDQGPAPVDYLGRRLRPYPELDVASHRPYAPSGVYVDHRDPAVEQAAYAQRDRVAAASNGARQAVLQDLADANGLRHWRDAYNTVRNVGRRQTGESGRDATGELRWRRWNTSHWSVAATATATVTAAASGSRCFGVELEFNRSPGDSWLDGLRHSWVTERAHEIAAAARADGLTFVEQWHRYGRDMSIAGWQGTYDSTTTGGEIISDILPGNDASLDEVRRMLAIIRDHGGVTAERQGIHVHHDTRDFTLTDRVRLVDNLETLAPLLEQYLPHTRRNGYWCGRMGASDWAQVRRMVAAGGNGPTGHNGPSAYNFGHIAEHSSRVEFRQFGQSLNSAKLRVWIRVGQAVVAATKAGYTFGAAATTESMLAALRNHGNLSASAARRFGEMVQRRGFALDQAA